MVQATVTVTVLARALAARGPVPVALQAQAALVVQVALAEVLAEVPGAARAAVHKTPTTARPARFGNRPAWPALLQPAPVLLAGKETAHDLSRRSPPGPIK